MDVTISDASEILKSSKEAIRQRIRRGTLQAEKREGVWYVILDDVQDSTIDAETACTEDEEYADSTEYNTVVQGLYESRIKDLEIHIEDLRNQLNTKDAQIEEKDRQLKAKDDQIARKDEQLKDLNITIVEWTRRLPEPKALPGPAQKRPWWKFWDKSKTFNY